MNRKKLLTLGIGLLATTAVASYIAVIKPQPISPKTTDSSVLPQTKDIKIAIVNEDSGTTYNGEALKMGETLINYFTSRVDYNVEVVSRATAESGLNNGSYQLMVILPSKFSEESLALESENPNQALFQYKIKADKPLLIEQAEQAVLDLKSHFNKDLINIYFLSIINNLQTAQSQVADVVANEESALNTYRNTLVDPLTAYSDKFSGLGTSPSDLLNSYNSLNDELQDTDEAFTSIIGTDRTYEADLEQIRSNQENWQTSLAEREKALADYNGELSSFTIEDQLATLTNLQTEISQYINQDGVWSDIELAAGEFQTRITDLSEKLTTYNQAIDSLFSRSDEKIKTAVQESITRSDGSLINGSPVDTTLGLYIQRLNDSMSAKIGAYLSGDFRFYADESIDEMSLSEVDKQYLKNINAFITWYRRTNGLAELPVRSATLQEDYFVGVKNTIREQLAEGGTFVFEQVEGTIANVTIKVPVNYAPAFSSDSGLSISSITDDVYTLYAAVPISEDGTVSIPYSVISPDDSLMSILDPVAVTVELTTEEVIPREVTADTIATSLAEESVASSGDTAPSDSSSQTESSAPPTLEEEPPVVTTTQQDDSITVKRVYSKTAVHFPLKDYVGGSLESSLYHDVKQYMEFSGLVKAYYDVDLSLGILTPETIVLGRNALITQEDVANLQDIVVNLVKATTVDTLKEELQPLGFEQAVFDEWTEEASVLVSDLTKLKEGTTSYSEQLNDILAKATEIQTLLKERPELLSEANLADNTDLSTVALDMNSDLIKLLTASQQLVDKTKANQGLSETIQRTMTSLSEEVTSLQKEGEDLSGRVAELRNVMSEEYATNEEFLKAFSGVLSNTKIGNAKNTAVYDYLSNPIDATKIESVLGAATATTPTANRRDERSGFLLVIIAYLASLSIAYLMQHTDIIRRQLKASKRVDWKNAILPMNFLTGLSLLASLVMTAIAGYRLTMAFSQTVLLLPILAVIVLLLTYVTNLLWEKGKGLGFLFSILVFMLYFVAATQLLEVYYVNNTRLLALLSPLTYIEQMLTAYINQSEGWRLPLVVLLLATFFSGGATAYTYRQLKK